MKKINFYEHGIKSSLLNRIDLKKFILSLFKKEGGNLKKVDIVFCTDKYVLSLNQVFLKHNYYTDTLTFLFSNPNDPIVGEIYLSVDRIKANAKTIKIPYQRELVRVIIHSCLHLCGYEDKPKKSFQIMDRIQEEYVKRWNVSRETQIGG